MAKKKNKGGGLPAVRKVPSVEPLPIPVFVRKECRKLEKSGALPPGFADDPLLDPLVKLAVLQNHPDSSPELQAICAKSVLGHWHADLALQVKEKLGPDVGGPQLFVVVRQFASPEEMERAAAKGNIDYNEPSAIALRDRSTTPPVPVPQTPAAVDRDRAPGAEIFEMQPDASGIERPTHTETAFGGFYELEKDPVSGVERLVKVDHTNRTFIPGAPDVKVEKDWNIN